MNSGQGNPHEKSPKIQVIWTNEATNEEEAKVFNRHPILHSRPTKKPTEGVQMMDRNGHLPKKHSKGENAAAIGNKNSEQALDKLKDFEKRLLTNAMVTTYN